MPGNKKLLCISRSYPVNQRIDISDNSCDTNDSDENLDGDPDSELKVELLVIIVSDNWKNAFIPFKKCVRLA